MNVLILTDFSAVSINAAEYSLQLLKDEPARFYLLNIDTGNLEFRKRFNDQREAVALEKLKCRVKSLKDLTSNSGHRFETLFSCDNLVNATRRYVEEKNIELIVMGAVRRDYSQNTLIGKHTYEIIKKVKCNILAIPENSSFMEPKEVVIPIDCSVSLDEKIFQFLGKYSLPSDTRFTVLEVKDKRLPQKAEVELEGNLLHPLNGRKLHFSEIEASVVAKEEFLEIQKDFQMIVLLGRNLSICERLLHNQHGLYSSVENRLPILVLHN